MRKWYVPITVLGLSGLGMLLLTERGRWALRWLYENTRSETLLEWNESAQRELERIQTALNRVAATLDAVQQHQPHAAGGSRI
jgi:hypothetical protein